MLLSVCINTYKRPQLLKKLIESLYKQKLPNEVSLEIIIVDNDVEKQGMSIAKSFNKTENIDIIYTNEPIQNISLARNKAVSLVTGSYILFIDDDGYADERWILEMYNCLVKYNADGVFGRIIPVYEDDIPDWVKKIGFFQYLEQKSGEVSKFVRTTSALIKAELIKTSKEPFDPRLGLIGGEDVDLFKRLKINGAKFIFCSEGVIYDWVPKKRANLNWMFKRSFRSGTTVTLNRLKYGKNKLFLYIFFLLKYLTFLVICIILMILFIPFRTKRNYWLLKFAGNLGHLATLVKIKYKEYKTHI